MVPTIHTYSITYSKFTTLLYLLLFDLESVRSNCTVLVGRMHQRSITFDAYVPPNILLILEEICLQVQPVLQVSCKCLSVLDS